MESVNFGRRRAYTVLIFGFGFLGHNSLPIGERAEMGIGRRYIVGGYSEILECYTDGFGSIAFNSSVFYDYHGYASSAISRVIGSLHMRDCY